MAKYRWSKHKIFFSRERDSMSYIVPSHCEIASIWSSSGSPNRHNLFINESLRFSYYTIRTDNTYHHRIDLLLKAGDRIRYDGPSSVHLSLQDHINLSSYGITLDRGGLVG